MGFTKPIEQYLFSNLLTKIYVFMYLKDIIRGVHSMCDVAERLEKMGMEKGMEIGKNTGIHEEKIRVYKKLLEKGFSEQEAQEITELQETRGM